MAAPAPAGAGRRRLDPSNLAMLRQLYVNLCVQHGLCAPSPDDLPGTAAHREAEAILAAGRDPNAPDSGLSWAAAYRAEQLIVRNLPTSELRAELARRGLGSITTEIRSVEETPYYYAEDAHQQYLHKNPYGYRCHANTGVAFPA